MIATGARRTVYLVGDGTNQETAVFTFEDGIIASQAGSKLFLPALMKQ